MRSLRRRRQTLRGRVTARWAPLTPEQRDAREHWQQRWNRPNLLAAIVPLFATSPARLARVARVLVATAGVRRFVARLGKVVVVAEIMVLVGAAVAYEAEHPTNPGFATLGDALWWGIITLTTVGYGDIVPKTPTGRIAGIAIMFTGVATIGVLAGSLASLFRLDEQGEAEKELAAGARPLHAELEALRSELQAVDRRVGQLAERAQES